MCTYIYIYVCIKVAEYAERLSKGDPSLPVDDKSKQLTAEVRNLQQALEEAKTQYFHQHIEKDELRAKYTKAVCMYAVEHVCVYACVCIFIMSVIHVIWFHMCAFVYTHTHRWRRTSPTSTSPS
jgi:hypothetical protein